MIKKVEIGEILDNNNSKDYHIICQASMGFTTLGTLSLRFPDRELLYDFVSHVDRRKEVGSLFPKYNISCYPLPFDTQINDIKFYTDVIIDALKLHELHIKTKYVAFVFDSYGKPINTELAKAALFEVYENQLKNTFKYNILYAVY